MSSRLAAIAAVVALGAAACGEARGSAFACTCNLLTDFDDASKHEVIVCAPSAERAPTIAQGCAQTGAPAPVQGCVCAPRGEACSLGACTQLTR